MSRPQRFLFMLSLIVAGEAVFSLPFHVARFFRPTVLEVFGFTNTELGAAQAAYGLLAMLAYFPGGPLADRFPARALLAASLVSTALGGVYMATIPSYPGAVAVFGFWGLTTILLFWAALIRATREWGGSRDQGKAYGILDGGRGVLAAGMASAAVVLFGLLFPAEAGNATMDERVTALRAVILGYTLATAGAAALVWFFIPARPEPAGGATKEPRALRGIGEIARMPAVWLQAAIVVCAYVGYKGFDNTALFAVEGYGMDEVEASQIAALSAWLRPVAAVGAGFLGDRIRSSRVVIVAFAVVLGADLFFGLAEPTPGTTWLLIGNVLLTCTGIYALRGVYFALFEEASVPAALTGTAVGLVSVIGYTPDIFVNLVGGMLLDASPGIAGHQQFYLFMAGFAAVGLLAAIAFERTARPSASRH